MTTVKCSLFRSLLVQCLCMIPLWIPIFFLAGEHGVPYGVVLFVILFPLIGAVSFTWGNRTKISADGIQMWVKRDPLPWKEIKGFHSFFFFDIGTTGFWGIDNVLIPKPWLVENAFEVRAAIVQYAPENHPIRNKWIMVS